jgi:hypothetical protein
LLRSDEGDIYPSTIRYVFGIKSDSGCKISRKIFYGMENEEVGRELVK